MDRDTLFIDSNLEFMIFYDINEACWVTLNIESGNKEPMLESAVREFASSPAGESATKFGHWDYPLQLFHAYGDNPKRLKSMLGRLAAEARLLE